MGCPSGLGGQRGTASLGGADWSGSSPSLGRCGWWGRSYLFDEVSGGALYSRRGAAARLIATAGIPRNVICGSAREESRIS